MLFSWLKRRRRRRLLAEPFPDEWRDVLTDNVHHYARLSAANRAKLCDDLRILVAEKSWEGCGGLTMTDEVRVTVAAQAALLLLGFSDEYFDAVRSILVYPDAYVVPNESTNRAGVVIQGESAREGEAWHRGPVVLSWSDALAGGRGHSHGNLVVHEFAHQLDMRNGEADGIPAMASREQYRRWVRVTRAAFRQLRHDCRHGEPTLLDCYGTKNRSEFFAVASETFFQHPRELADLHGDLYDALAEFYHQDPARWR